MIPTPEQHPLPRDGTSQASRLAPALDPAPARLDDRRLDDLLYVTRQVAARVTYFNLVNQADQTWLPFLDGKVPIELAVLARWDLQTLRLEIDARLAEMEAGPEAQTLIAADSLVALLASTLATVDAWTVTFSASSFLAAVERVVTQTVAPHLPVLVATLKALPDPEAVIWIQSLQEALASSLWDVHPDDIPPDPAVAAATRAEQWTALRSRLESPGVALVEALSHLSVEADAFLNSSSLLTGDHPPHLGLLLAWLSQFRHGQAALNDLVRRHLEFYYRALLQIRPQPALLDRAFVTFEPAKNTLSTRLAEDTRLYAGKDDGGVERQFALTRDLIVNRATVAELRSTFIDAANLGQWRVASIANSADGLGASLPKDRPAWHPFGHPGLPAGRRGFAVAASVLQLTGGDKTVTLAVQLAATAGSILDGRCQDAASRGGASSNGTEWPLDAVFSVAFTGTDGWLSLDPSRVAARFNPGSNLLTLTMDGLGPEQSVVPYDPATHGLAYATALPLLEITLRVATLAYPGDFLDGLAFDRVTVACSVADDANLVVSTDLGSVDITKPFQPFGPSPTAATTTTAGSSFYVGSAEILGKHLTFLGLKPAWKEVPAGSLTGFLVRPYYLSETRWRELGTTGLPLFGTTIDLPSAALSLFEAQPGLAPVTALVPGLERGFIRLSLSAPSTAFGHAGYVAAYTQAIVTAVNSGSDPALPATPVSPTIAALLASYTADEARDFATDDHSPLEFHHVEPHGQWPVTGTTPELLPPGFPDGAFLIGLDGATADSQVTLLFHLADGSGDPFANYPLIAWEYLADDAWLPFETEDVVVDGTNQLRRTGVMVFALPADASTLHTRMPSGRVWIRAVADGDPATGYLGALNLAYAITAQAAEAAFVDRGNDLGRLDTPLPAGSVTRLVSANPAIKKVVQPLPSTGGALAEAGLPYYRRVSERLRHRQRAIALWDYERLVLEAFPVLHKVKCIPHSNPDSELAPGEVTVVLVPQLTAEAFDPQRPAASQDLLAEVAAFLAPLVSAHVRLHVVNPLYDEVQVIARLAFRPGYDQGFSLTQAATDLTQFLAPWAFGETGALAFGREIFPSTILNFLEERDYLDYVSEFRVRQFVDGVALSPDPMVLTPNTERSILVSHPLHDLSLA